MIRVWIRYVDGTESDAPADRWSELRSDGVDSVSAGTWKRRTTTAGHSVYWLRRVGDEVRLGCASFYANPIYEIAIAPDGTQREIPLSWVPDLHHDEVKLGWWWPGG